jgi:hypothetical protein
MTPGVVPMIAPDGSTGDIPNEKVADATRAGFKPAVVMTSPDGQMGYVPRERAADAIKAGFKVGQPETQFEKNGGKTGNERFADATTEKGLLSRGANYVRGAVSSVTAPILHPLETAKGMGEGVIAGGMTPYGTPITAPTGNEEIDRQNEQIHREAQQRAMDAGAQELKDHPAYVAGQFTGPLLVGEALKNPAIRAGAENLVPKPVKAAISTVANTRPLQGSLAGKMAEVPPGEQFSRQQVVDAAKANNVNLDVAQATDSGAVKAIKRRISIRLRVREPTKRTRNRICQRLRIGRTKRLRNTLLSPLAKR